MSRVGSQAGSGQGTNSHRPPRSAVHLLPFTNCHRRKWGRSQEGTGNTLGPKVEKGKYRMDKGHFGGCEGQKQQAKLRAQWYRLANMVVKQHEAKM